MMDTPVEPRHRDREGRPPTEKSGAAPASLVEACRTSIKTGSKTFRFASLFFNRENLQDAAMLYQWCRHCDDAIDGAPAEQHGRALAFLRLQTDRAIQGLPVDDVAFQALRYLMSKHHIPAHYPRELIEGMRMDTAFAPPRDLAELELYCYRVAGVVGLMMAHVMGISDEKALKHACDLGIAMQMTNIARDVMADHALGRCYLPEELLRKYGLTAADIARPENRGALARAVDELLEIADRYYQSGENGTRYLSSQSALVILIARYTYADIGRKVRRLGAAAWDDRVYTTKFEKAACLARAVTSWLKHLPSRPRFVARPIRDVWRWS